MFRHCRPGGMIALSLGIGILLSMILPIGCVIFIGAVALIILGITWMRKP